MFMLFYTHVHTCCIHILSSHCTPAVVIVHTHVRAMHACCSFCTYAHKGQAAEVDQLSRLEPPLYIMKKEEKTSSTKQWILGKL